MICVPINVTEDKHSILIIIIEKGNLDRMKQGDPITLESGSQGGVILGKSVQFPQNLSMMIAYEEDEVELYKVVKAGDPIVVLKYLERGRKWDAQMDGKANMFSFKKGTLHLKVTPDA